LSFATSCFRPSPQQVEFFFPFEKLGQPTREASKRPSTDAS
jgi:hypothetical protein